MKQRSHTFWVWIMVLVCVMWSISGIVTRNLQQAKTFEVTFWRSLFAAMSVAVILIVQRGGVSGAMNAVKSLGRVGFASSLCWAAMFTCFMLALTQTSTANTFVVNALYPVFAAALAWIVLGTRVPARTWLAMAAAIGGLVYMVAAGLGDGVLGIFIALGVPIGAAINVVIIKRYGANVDLIPAVLVGAVLSALFVLPFSLPLKATTFDVSALALLGVVQLGVPCAMMVVVARHLPPAEVALLSLLEAILAPLWTWIGVNEIPTTATIIGGGIALAAITANETLAYFESKRRRDAT
jgi:drug/metabolite transporter (DMT)-like permease